MKGVYFGLVLFVGILNFAFSQTIATSQDGPWNQASTWVGGTIPTSANSTSIVIQHNVNVPNAYSVTVDQVFIDINGLLTVDAGGTVTVADDGTAATDLDCFNDGIDYGYLTVNGTLIGNNSSTITGTDQGNTSFNSGSIYRHLYTTSEGSIPVANWDSNSTVQVQGYTTSITATSTGNWGQNFGNFTFNCSSLASGVVQMQGLLLTVNNLTISSTGTTGSFRLATTQNPPITIASDLTISGASRVIFNTTGASTTIDIGRDFIYNSTNTSGSTTNSTGNTTFTVGRDFSMNASGGQLILASGSGAGNGTFNVTGNFTLTAGTITETSSSTGVGNINFLAGLHTFSNAGTIANSINFTINNSATVNLGTSAIAGGGSFTLGPSAVLQVGSTDTGGAIQIAASVAGNIRTTGTRTFDASSTIVYNGAGPQKIGNAFPTNVNLEINNSSGVTNNNVGVTNVIGNLTLSNGPFYIGASNTLNVQSNFFVTNGTIGGSSTSNLTFSGSGTLSTLSFYAGSEILNNLTLTRITNLTLGSNLTIGGVLDLSGGNLDFSGRTLTINGGSITSSGTGLKSNSLSTLTFGGSTFSGSVPFSGSGNQLSNLTFGTGGGAYTWSSGVTINGTLTLSAGALTHSSGITMAANSTFMKGSGTISGIAPTAASGGYNVTYTGTGNTGLELPTSSTGLKNLSVNASGGTVTLSSAITINGNFDVSNGTFAVGSNSVTMKGATWSSSGGSFSAGTGTVTFSGTTALSGLTTFNNISVSGVVTLSSATTTVIGNIANTGTINSGAGLVVFSGATAITGAGTSSFNDLTISGTLTAPSGTMNVSGDFTDNGTFTHNAGSVVFNGATTFSGTTPSFNNVSITGSVTAPSTWNIAGNLSNSGTFNNNNGTLVLNGTVSAQSITGTFNANNINVSNPSGVNNNGTINLSGVLTLTSSSALFDADGSGSGNLLIKSTAVNAGGRIAALPTPGNFSGDVTVERFINNSGQPDFWRLLSMPITNGTVAKWKSNFPVSGNFTDPSPAGVNNVGADNTQPSIYFWNAATQAYAAIGSGAAVGSTNVANNRGYYVYTFLTSDFTASVKGPAQTGNLSIPISSTTNSYALIPNPYPSPIDWDNMDRTGLNSSMSLKNPAKASTSYVAGGPATNAPYVGWAGEVAIGQSFWVQSNGASSISLTESAKTLFGFQFIREKEPENYLRITLSSETQHDEAVVWFVDGSTAKHDSKFDAPKMPNSIQIPGTPYEPYLNISTSVAGETGEYAINSVAPITCNTKFNINISEVAKGGHTLSFTDLDKMNLGYSIVLVDKFTRIERPVTQDLAYEFNVTADSASFGNERFELRVLMPGSPYLNSMVGPKISILNACDPATLPVTFKAEAGVDYQFMMNGVAVTEVISAKQSGNIEVSIPREKLEIGNNNFSLIATSRLACDQFTYPKALEFNNQAILPVNIETSGSLLLTDPNTTSQWFKDGAAIENAKSSSYMVTEPGEYFVQRNFGGCLVNSKVLSVSLESLSGQYLQVFPNPAKNQVNFILSPDIQRNLKSILVFDVKGVKVFDSGEARELMNSPVKSIDVSNQKPGIYIIKIVSDKVHHLKFIKE